MEKAVIMEKAATRKETVTRGGKRLDQIKHYKTGDPEYPERLRNIPGAPQNLFVLGKLPEEGRLSVAVIGARDCSEYGKYVARELGTVLGGSGIAVISGMARGIDGISQEAALDAGGSSYAVLGCGVDVCYPEANRQLYERLKISGGILSEYPPGAPALARHFPPRNRIVSGLADVVVVIEARVKSGTLITVDMALEQGREVYVVPGRVTDRLSDGCNRLIRQGAGILLSPEEFLRELLEGEIGRTALLNLSGRMAAGKAQPGGAEGLAPEVAAVLGALELTPLSLEQIRARLPAEYQDKRINTYLMRLCMEGLAIQVSPGYFCRAF